MDAMLGFLGNMAFLLPLLLVTHATITAAGFWFADADVLRDENDNLLDEMEEGLIILKHDTY